ncbi:MAG TPA: hypothetical protein VNH18_05430 [Bryobacteraceae bacterium]|nr:hypothetical protein [Blastocatellia bacterium]HXJ38696.1 hypothetical protein [Bryobacteraceae bacterium]
MISLPPGESLRYFISSIYASFGYLVAFGLIIGVALGFRSKDFGGELTIGTYFLGLYRIWWGFCPKCNSDAPGIDTCDFCDRQSRWRDHAQRRNWKYQWREFRERGGSSPCSASRIAGCIALMWLLTACGHLVFVTGILVSYPIRGTIRNYVLPTVAVASTLRMRRELLQIFFRAHGPDTLPVPPLPPVAPLPPSVSEFARFANTPVPPMPLSSPPASPKEKR